MTAQATPTLRIRNWSRWQSYRADRGQPPWIKIHRCVMRNPDWVALTDAQRGQLVAIWLLAADHDGVIPASPTVLRKLCYLDSEPDLQTFVDQGFIEGDASVTPTRRQLDPPETETETETETEAEIEADESLREGISDSRESRSTPAKQKRAHQWPHEAHALPGEFLERATVQGYTLEQAHEMGSAFLDHHIARGSTFKDWHRAWSTWMRNEKKFNGKGHSPGDAIVADIDDIPF